MNIVESLHGRHIAGRRARILGTHIAAMIPKGATVLDVGCGDGTVASLIKDRRPDLMIQGVEVLVREETRIPVTAFDGARLPFPDASVDVLLLVDVLHHTKDPTLLLRECARVTRRHIIIKDHLREGVLAERTLRFMDGVGNRRYGVALPMNYWNREQWEEARQALAMTLEQQREALHLYPWPASLLFDRSLHFLTRWRVPRRTAEPCC